jgi:hypothetical protein
MPEPPSRFAISTRFDLLVEFLLGGTVPESMRIGKFETWEMDILLDVEGHGLRRAARRDALLEYQRLVQADLKKGAQLPLRFSEYLERAQEARTQRQLAHAQRKAPKAAAAGPPTGAAYTD